MGLGSEDITLREAAAGEDKDVKLSADHDLRGLLAIAPMSPAPSSACEQATPGREYLGSMPRNKEDVTQRQCLDVDASGESYVSGSWAPEESVSLSDPQEETVLESVRGARADGATLGGAKAVDEHDGVG